MKRYPRQTTAEIEAMLTEIAKTATPAIRPHMWAKLTAARLRDAERLYTVEPAK